MRSKLDVQTQNIRNCLIKQHFCAVVWSRNTPNPSPPPSSSGFVGSSGLFSPELESSTKYCLERVPESSVRLCLTS